MPPQETNSPDRLLQQKSRNLPNKRFRLFILVELSVSPYSNTCHSPLFHFSQLQYLRFASFFLFCPNAFHPVPCPSSFYSNTPHSTPLFLFSTFLYSNPFHFSFSLFQYIPFFPSFPSPIFQLLPLRPIFFFSLKSKHTSQKFSFPKTEKLKNPPYLPQYNTVSVPISSKNHPSLTRKNPPYPFPLPSLHPLPFPHEKRINPFGFILFCIPYIRICLQIPN